MRHSRLFVWKRPRHELWNNTCVCVLHKPAQCCVQAWISTCEQRWSRAVSPGQWRNDLWNNTYVCVLHKPFLSPSSPLPSPHHYRRFECCQSLPRMIVGDRSWQWWMPTSTLQHAEACSLCCHLKTINLVTRTHVDSFRTAFSGRVTQHRLGRRTSRRRSRT